MRSFRDQVGAGAPGPLSARVAQILLLAGLLAGAAPLSARSGDAAGPYGDAAKGEEIYQRCAGCHSLGYNRTGPKHCGIMGRRAGGVEGYAYSDAMRASDIVWTRETLDLFLASPGTLVRGTTMGYAGIASEQERRDLIAFLESVSESPDRCRQTED